MTTVTFNSKDIIKEIVAETVTPELKLLGYRKTSFTWCKSVGEVTRLVDIQLSQYNRAHESRFTVNLGVYHPILRQAHSSRVPRGNIFEYNCDVQMRIGELMGRGDFWWLVAWNKDNKKVKEELHYNLTHHAIPWLETFSTIEDVYRYFLEIHQYFDAAVAAYVLKKDNVSDLIRKATAEAPHANFARFIEVWARDRNIAT